MKYNHLKIVWLLTTWVVISKSNKGIRKKLSFLEEPIIEGIKTIFPHIKFCKRHQYDIKEMFAHFKIKYHSL